MAVVVCGPLCLFLPLPVSPARVWLTAPVGQPLMVSEWRVLTNGGATSSGKVLVLVQFLSVFPSTLSTRVHPSLLPLQPLPSHFVPPSLPPSPIPAHH